MTKISRRSFLILTGSAGAALAGSGCSTTVNKLIPYVNPPHYPQPGEWIRYATTCRECPAGCGMHMRHRDGRVTKAEGNPESPINYGKLCARGQSSVQGQYDPDRLKNVFYRENRNLDEKLKSDWESAISEISKQIKNSKGRVLIISDLQTGSLAEIMEMFTSNQKGKVLWYEPFNYEVLRKANQLVFGEPLIPRYKLDDTDFIMSFGADFLETWISPVEYAGQFKKMHEFEDGKMGNFIYVGPRFSGTATNADEFIMVSPESMEYTAYSILSKIISNGWSKRDVGSLQPEIDNYLSMNTQNAVVPDKKIEALAKKYSQSGSALALAGASGVYTKENLGTAVAVNLLNYAAGNLSNIDFSTPHALSKTAMNNEVNDFFKSINKDDIIIVHNSNPVYTWSGSEKYLMNAGKIIYMGTMEDETAKISDWMLPINYPLEEWGDYEPYKGIHSLMQPAMQSLHATYSAGNILLALSESAGNPLSRKGSSKPADHYEDWVKQYWQGKGIYKSDDELQDVLRKGIYNETTESAGSNPAKNISIKTGSLNLNSNTVSNKNADELQLWTYPAITLFDGRFSNRGWMQEIPDPLTNITWSSWIDINVDKARELGLDNFDMVEIESDAGKIKVPVRLTIDLPVNVLSIGYGQGHTALGKNAADRGANAFILINRLNETGLVKLKSAGGNKHPVFAAATDHQFGREGIYEWIELDILEKMKPGDGEHLIMPLPEGYDEKRDLYPVHTYKEHRWAMSIDLHACIGCKACETACYAENNIPVVGEENVNEGLEMSWIKVVPYRMDGNPQKVGWLPLPCQQCDAAPCEPVCPVFAAVHNEEGLNAQIYNRCIGTRYCSNNCPYKVRRFNWFNFHFEWPLDMQLNPEVTVRVRGVMEKCTFCVQRIRNVEYHKKTAGEKIEDGDITPACVQTCPTSAIVFGDLLDDNSRVTGITRHHLRRYHVLEELNTKPAVTYLKRIDAGKNA